MALLKSRTQVKDPYLAAASKMSRDELASPATRDGKRCTKALYLISESEEWAFALGVSKNTYEFLFRNADASGTPLIVHALTNSKRLSQFYAESHPEIFLIKYSTRKETGKVTTSIGGEIASVHPEQVAYAAERKPDILNAPANERAKEKVAHVFSRFYATHTHHGTRDAEHARTASHLLGLLRSHTSYTDANWRGQSPKTIVAAVHKREFSRIAARRSNTAREATGKPVKDLTEVTSGPLKIATEVDHHHIMSLRRRM